MVLSLFIWLWHTFPCLLQALLSNPSLDLSRRCQSGYYYHFLHCFHEVDTILAVYLLLIISFATQQEIKSILLMKLDQLQE